MTIIKLREDMNIARQKGDSNRVNILKELIGAVEKLGIEKGQKDYPEAIVNAAITKEKKIAQGMIDTCPATRPDLAAEYHTRITIINEYVPQLLDEAAIQAQVKTMFESNPNITNMGAAMKIAGQIFKGKADMSLVSKAVKAYLFNR